MSKTTAPKTAPMTVQAAARIQSHTARESGGKVQATDFAARAQRAAAVNQRAPKGSK